VRRLERTPFNNLNQNLICKCTKKHGRHDICLSSFFFSIRSIPRSLSQQNKHLLILDGHGSHVTLEAIKQTYEARLNMITLPSHTSHTLQPLDINYFRPFKYVFRKERDESMFRNNYRKPGKVTLVGWVDRALNQSLYKQNIKVGFKTTWIWPLNPRAMDNQSKPNELYIVESNLDISNDEDGQL
jgi:hypothetical protein